MKKRNYIMDFAIGLFAIVMILFSAKSLKFNNSKEIKDTEKQASGNPPANVVFSATNFSTEYGTLVGFPMVHGYADATFGTQTGFCLDATKEAPRSNVTYSNPTAVNPSLAYIVKDALDKGIIGNVSNLTDTSDINASGTTQIKYYAYQLAVHILNGQQGGTAGAFDNIADSTQQQNAIDYTVDLVNRARAYNNSNPTVTFGGPYTLNKVDGQSYYETSAITVNSNTTGATITLSLENALAGAGIYKDGVAVTQVTAGDSITVRVPASSLTNQNQQFTIKGDTTKTIYNVYQYQPDDTQYQPIMTPEYYETTVQGSGNTTVQGKLDEEPPVDPTYSITINKKDDSNNMLAGATLALYNGDQLIEQWVSTTSAKTINDINAGTYTIKEISAPNGYTKSQDLTITVDATHLTFDVINVAVPEEKGSITVTKKDNNNQDLAGATIKLYNQAGTEVGSWTSSAASTSHTFTDLPVGTYTLRETGTPVGYMTANDITVNVTNGNTASANFINQPTSVTIKKVDENNQPLAGAHLQVLNNQGTVVDEWDTDTTGVHTISKLAVGTYTIKETVAPNGYVLKTSTQQFTVSAGQATAEQVFTNAKTVVKVSKIDADTGALVSGANLVIYDENGAQVANFISNGTIKEITGLVPGNYTLKETQAPDGYALNENAISFTVANNGQEVEVSMQNNKIVEVPSTSSSISKLLLIFGTLLIIVGGSFVYYYVKFPKVEQ